MKRRYIILTALSIILIGGVTLLITASDRIVLEGAIRHQLSVTRELTEWAEEYGHPRTKAQAVRTAEMLSYVQTYYVVGEGCRSTPEVETQLEGQRTKTIDTLVEALRKFTGQDFGTDSKAWLGHLSTLK